MSQGEALDGIKPAARLRGDKLAPAEAGGGAGTIYSPVGHMRPTHERHFYRKCASHIRSYSFYKKYKWKHHFRQTAGKSFTRILLIFPAEKLCLLNI